MAISDQITKVSPKHEAILTFLVANPQMKRGDVARHFGVSQSWLSVIINSDAFQAKLRERQDEFFDTATAPIKAKLDTLANLALDTMIERVEVEPNSSEIREMAKMALDRLGYAPQNSQGTHMPGAATQNNYFLSVAPELLDEARRAIISRGKGETIEHGKEERATAYLPAAT